MTFLPTRTLMALGTAAATLLALPAAAQDYPSKPITMVVPFGPGSGTDQMARLYAKALGDQVKVPIVVENKGGANGFIAAQYVAKAAPDGYTLMMTTNTTHAANEHLFKKIPYDPVKDFAPIGLLATGQMLLLVKPDSPYKSVADLLAAARKTPGKLDFGSGSSSSQVAGFALQQMAHLDMLNVPYKSNPQAITDLIGGRFTFMFSDTPTALPQVQGGKLRALATSGSHRVAALPDLPTVAEAGVKGYDVSYWFAAYAPAGTPPAIVAKLNQMFNKASATDEVKAYMKQTSGTLTSSTPEGLAKFQATESKKWGEVIRAAGIEQQ
ncbi:Bug family tripartite tricarboxylate transporter substrate binding protein [Ottowia sp.]|uniref:Bug family tripartite tricarboxylate transporter substrate binding protein n=1 Tax=Ottowia sp. TaxID=1898956 RepID=UPI002B776658|nr:tripartite tricarboxylate transporter substrate binding protein [Ottowia sp.]